MRVIKTNTARTLDAARVLIYLSGCDFGNSQNWKAILKKDQFQSVEKFSEMHRKNSVPSLNTTTSMYASPSRRSAEPNASKVVRVNIIEYVIYRTGTWKEIFRTCQLSTFATFSSLKKTRRASFTIPYTVQMTMWEMSDAAVVGGRSSPIFAAKTNCLRFLERPLRPKSMFFLIAPYNM